MGLTNESVGWRMLRRTKTRKDSDTIVVALAGNPNTGKSTIFNELTGLHQHTGNWPGKTVLQATGEYAYQGKDYLLVDLPGTYSLLASSKEEEVARDFLYFDKPRVTVVVTDATCLERNLNLVYQIMEISPNVICCVNLMDEAKRKNIEIDCELLEKLLGVPVIPMTARSKKGFEQLKDTIAKVSEGKIINSPNLVRYNDAMEDKISTIQQTFEGELKEEYSSRWLAIRMLEKDEAILDYVHQLQDGEGTDE